MRKIPFKLKIKTLRIILGFMILFWLLDFGQDWRFFFPQGLIDKQQGSFWNILAQISNPIDIFYFIALAVPLSLLFIFGIAISITGFILGYLVICFFQINPTLYSPALPFLLWLIFSISILGSKSRPQSSHYRILYFGAWSILAVGYFISGLDKVLHSEAWKHGDALHYILSGPLARWPEAFSIFKSLPEGIQSFMTWSVPLLEIAFLPMAMFATSRKIAWWLLTALHLMILAVLWLPSVSVGMLVFNLFLLDSEVDSTMPNLK